MTPSPLIVALLDGTVVDAAAPLLRPDDVGVLRGEGVFETTLAVDGAPRDLDAHLRRLAASARMLDLVLPDAADWRRGIDAVLGAWRGDRQMVLRLFATRGPETLGVPTCFVTGGPLPATSVRQRRDGVRVLLLDRGFAGPEVAVAPWLLAGAKTLSYAVNMAALRHAAAEGADDVIFVGADGALLEGPTSTVVLARDRVLMTPPREGILDGITVRRLFAAAERAGWPTKVVRLTSEDLVVADGVWLASSARLLAPVVAVNGAPRGDGGLTAELAGLLEVPAGG